MNYFKNMSIYTRWQKFCVNSINFLVMESRHRPFWTTGYFIILFLLDCLGLYSIKELILIEIEDPLYPKYVLYIQGVLCVSGIICIISLFKWKKFGIYGLILLTILSLLINAIILKVSFGHLLVEPITILILLILIKPIWKNFK